MSQGISLAERAIPAVRGLHLLLIQVIKRPQQYCEDEDFKNALKSQGGIAKLDRAVTNDTGETFKVFPMSLNSLKTYADNNLPGGFKALNDLRLKAGEALALAGKREERGNKRTRSGLALKVAELEHQLLMHRQTNMLLLKALAESHDWFFNIRDASDAAHREKFTLDAANNLRAILSMATPPFNTIETAHTSISSSDVANINEYRKD